MAPKFAKSGKCSISVKHNSSLPTNPSTCTNIRSTMSDRIHLAWLGTVPSQASRTSRSTNTLQTISDFRQAQSGRTHSEERNSSKHPGGGSGRPRIQRPHKRLAKQRQWLQIALLLCSLCTWRGRGHWYINNVMAKLLQWKYVRGLQANREELTLLLSSVKPTIVALQETNIAKNHNINFRNYHFYNTPGAEIKGVYRRGSALIVDKATPRNLIALRTNLQATAVRVTVLTRLLYALSTFLLHRNGISSKTWMTCIDNCPPTCARGF